MNVKNKIDLSNETVQTYIVSIILLLYEHAHYKLRVFPTITKVQNLASHVYSVTFLKSNLFSRYIYIYNMVKTPILFLNQTKLMNCGHEIVYFVTC